MSDRDGVLDADYDCLRSTGLTREQCWAICDCIRSKRKPPNAKRHETNLKRSGVRVGYVTLEPTEDPSE